MNRIREVEIITRFGSGTVPKSRYLSFALDVMNSLEMRGRVAVLFCGAEKMRELNRYFLGKDRPTDVLSFPSGTEEEGGMINVGDIAVCVPVAKAQAAENGWPLDSELKKLLVHAFLHLAGFDHAADSGEMEKKERSLLRTMGVKG